MLSPPPGFAIAAPSCSVMCSHGSLFMFSAAFCLWCSILSKYLFLYKYACPEINLNQNTTHISALASIGGGWGAIVPK